MEEKKLESMEAIDFLYPQKIPYMDRVNVEVKKYIVKGCELRKNNIFFIAHMLMKENADKYFIQLMNHFYIPLLCDTKYQVFSGGDLAMMLVPQAFFNMFSKANNKCLMYEFCVEGTMPQIDESCLKNPWKQSEKENLCPFATYWCYYSLNGKEIIKEN